eukprot:3874532-Prymnesium_polylepis.2
MVPLGDLIAMRAALRPPRELGYPLHVIPMNESAWRFDLSCEGVPGKKRAEVNEKRPGHLEQQLWNLYADKLSPSGAEFILFMDSDCLFTSWYPLARWDSN